VGILVVRSIRAPLAAIGSVDRPAGLAHGCGRLWLCCFCACQSCFCACQATRGDAMAGPAACFQTACGGPGATGIGRTRCARQSCGGADRGCYLCADRWPAGVEVRPRSG